MKYLLNSFSIFIILYCINFNAFSQEKRYNSLIVTYNEYPVDSLAIKEHVKLSKVFNKYKIIKYKPLVQNAVYPGFRNQYVLEFEGNIDSVSNDLIKTGYYKSVKNKEDIKYKIEEYCGRYILKSNSGVFFDFDDEPEELKKRPLIGIRFFTEP